MAKKEKIRHATKSTPSTQKYLQIAEIRDDTVIMKDGSIRSVLLVSSINFALKSEDEQNAIVSAYVNFLNSMDSPMQILIQSRKLDLEQYLNYLKDAAAKQTNDLLKMQMAEYQQYITELVSLGNIMTKRFYVIVPFEPFSSKSRGFWARTGDVLSPTSVANVSQKIFASRQKELFTIVDRVLSGLAGMGLRAQVLDTQALIELFYNTYNPTVAPNEKMEDINKLMMETSM
ncbi:MAG: TraC family protein [Candidatus Buchananbacteria bacterium]